MKRKATALTLILALFFSGIVGAFLVKSARANPIINIYRGVSPPTGTQAPIITIHSPQNGSSYPKNITLTFDVAVPQTNGDKSLDGVTKVYYRGSWETNEVTVGEGRLGSFSVNLSDVRGGNFSVTVYAVGVGYVETGEDYREQNGVLYSYHYYDRFTLTGYSTVSFIKDLVSPRITVLSPKIKTYGTSDVELDFAVDEAVSQIQYCLDGLNNVTVAGNTTLTGLPNGDYSVTVYALDEAGNAGVSETIHFKIDTFPTLFVITASAASVAVGGLGLLVYFKKRKH